MSHISVTPSTPPRSSGKSSRSVSTPLSSTTPIQQRNGLITPSTTSKSKNPFLASNTNHHHSATSSATSTSTTPTTFKTPSSISKKKSSHLTIPKSSSKLLPITPEFTPNKSPSRKRKLFGNMTDIFHNQLTVDSTHRKEKISFGLLLPAPSKVGSGRHHARSINKDNIFLTHNNMNEDGVDDDDSLMIFHEEEEDLGIPQTPGSQLINDSLVNHWHGKSYNNYYSSDEEDEGNATEIQGPTKLENPFLTTTKSLTTNTVHKVNPFDDVNSNSINYDTHMELVNNKTGQIRIVKLTANQSKIKPKKLDFSGI